MRAHAHTHMRAHTQAHTHTQTHTHTLSATCYPSMAQPTLTAQHPAHKRSTQVCSRQSGAVTDNIKCHLIWPLHRADLRGHSALSLDGTHTHTHTQHSTKFASQPLNNRTSEIMADSGDRNADGGGHILVRNTM